MLRVVSRFHEAVYSDPDSPTGLNQVLVDSVDPNSKALTCPQQNLDFRSVILDYDRQLTQYFEEWMERFRRDSDMTGAISDFRIAVHATDE